MVASVSHTGILLLPRKATASVSPLHSPTRKGNSREHGVLAFFYRGLLVRGIAVFLLLLVQTYEVIFGISGSVGNWQVTHS